jgi:ankyrin repeat protein
VCKILLLSGANPDSLTRAGKASPLHRAAYAGHSDIVKILAEHGAKLDLVDIDGQTALHKAMQIYFYIHVFMLNWPFLLAD